MSEQRKPSKYAAKKKFIYSPLYHQWRASVASFGAGDARTLDIACRHAKMMHVKSDACNGVTLGNFSEDCINC